MVSQATLLFDRGTLILRAAEPLVRRLAPAGLMWDPRVHEWRAPAFAHEAIARALAAAGVRIDDRVRDRRLTPARWRDVALRPHQLDALRCWQVHGGRGVVALPTGSGKTRVALAAIAAGGAPALVVVPTRALVEQWVRAIGEFYEGPVGVYGDGERTAAAVTVATFESAYRHMDRLGNLFDLVVVDEAHHFAAGIRVELLEMCVAARRIGLSATPPTDGEALARLARHVGPVVYARSVGELVGRCLADLDVVELQVDLDEDERAEYERERAIFAEFHRRFRRVAPRAPWAELVAAAMRSPDGRRALEAFRRSRAVLGLPAAKRRAVRDLLAAHRGRRTLVFTCDNDAAYRLSRELLVPAITCEIERREREQALARFREGVYPALVSARVLNEGIDVPDAEVGIVVGGAQGAREHVQRVGRLLRPGPGKRALVYELVAAGTAEVASARRRRAGLGA